MALRGARRAGGRHRSRIARSTSRKWEVWLGLDVAHLGRWTRHGCGKRGVVYLALLGGGRGVGWVGERVDLCAQKGTRGFCSL